MVFFLDIFSYWIVIWFILFILFHTLIYIPNPKFMIILGIIANGIVLFEIIKHQNSIDYTMKFLLVIVITKLIPFYFVYNYKLSYKDIRMSLFIFILYGLYMICKYKNPISTYLKINHDMIHGKSKSPLLNLLSYTNPISYII